MGTDIGCVPHRLPWLEPKFRAIDCRGDQPLDLSFPIILPLLILSNLTAILTTWVALPIDYLLNNHQVKKQLLLIYYKYKLIHPGDLCL